MIRLIKYAPRLKNLSNRPNVFNTSTPKVMDSYYFEFKECVKSHPFIRRTADMSLPKRNFSYFMHHEIYFIKSFANAFSISIKKLEYSHNPNIKAIYPKLKSVANELLTSQHVLQKNYLKKLNSPKNTPINGIALSYSNFLMDKAINKPPIEAFIPFYICCNLYVEIGKEYKDDMSEKNPYKKWVVAQCSEKAEARSKLLESTYDALYNECNSKQESEIETIYNQTLQYEHNFFQTAFNYNRKNRICFLKKSGKKPIPSIKR